MVRRANRLKRPLSPRLNQESLRRIARGLVGSAVARAQAKYDVEVFALTVMSSHLHLVLRTKKKNLAAFMGYVNAQIAKGVNRVTGKRGGLWGRRYDAQPILDDAAAEALTAYTVRNPVAARLVERHDEWPGLNLAYGVGDADELPFEWLDCGAWHRANRPVDLAPFFETATLKLSPLPHCAGFTREAMGRMLEAWMRQAEADQAAKDEAQGRVRDRRRARGVRAVVKARLEERSRNASFERRPYAFGASEAKAKERASMHMISMAHARASVQWLAGDHSVAFPPGTYRPPLTRVA
jgi:REP element-mobilizing transposase RayT